jgi:hypothetical protein
MLWLGTWLFLIGSHAQDVRDLSHRFTPPDCRGNPWGPAVTRARAEGRVPSIVMSPEMLRWDQWGRAVLRDGDIVFRMGDARFAYNLFPFSRFLAAASGSRFSHAGIVAIEDGGPVVYDCIDPSIGRMPFAVWVLDNVGAFGVKRLKAERREAIPGVLAYCRKAFEEQAPFDFSFDLDDSALYCLEMTEKAFRSQGLVLSKPVRLGDMENATHYPITIGMFLLLSKFVLKKPLSLEQAVYMPGNARHGLWGSPLLESVYSPPGDPAIENAPRQKGRISLMGDVATVVGILSEFRTSGRLRLQRELRFGLCSTLPEDLAAPVSLPTARAGYSRGIGILGESYFDEYPLASPDHRTARNWVEILSLTRRLDFGRFSATGWGSPRDRGYQYNWARADATTSDLIATGQHTGLAAQVASGQIGTVFVFIGGNDFIEAMSKPDPEAALREALPRALSNYQLAIKTIRAAAPSIQLVLATVPDIRLLPEFDQALREGRLAVRVADVCTAVMARYNAQIRAMAATDKRVVLIDLALFAQLADQVSHDFIVSGRRLDRSRPGKSSEFFFLADRRHPGTLAQAELARKFVLAVNARFGAGIEPLRDTEILRLVGELTADGPADRH